MLPPLPLSCYLSTFLTSINRPSWEGHQVWYKVQCVFCFYLIDDLLFYITHVWFSLLFFFSWSGGLGLMVYFVVGPGTSLPFRFVWPTPLSDSFYFVFVFLLHWNLDWCLYKLFPCVFDVRFYKTILMANSTWHASQPQLETLAYKLWKWKVEMSTCVSPSLLLYQWYKGAGSYCTITRKKLTA